MSQLATLRSKILINGSATTRWTVVFADGGGLAMDAPFMSAIAEGLASQRLRTVRFEFPDMVRRRVGGHRRSPDRESVLR